MVLIQNLMEINVFVNQDFQLILMDNVLEIVRILLYLMFSLVTVNVKLGLYAMAPRARPGAPRGRSGRVKPVYVPLIRLDTTMLVVDVQMELVQMLSEQHVFVLDQIKFSNKVSSLVYLVEQIQGLMRI